MDIYEDDDEPGFFKRHRIALGFGAVLLAGAIVVGIKLKDNKGTPAPRPQAPIVMIKTLPPPPKPTPPPATPPPTPPPQEVKQEMQQQEKITDAPQKPEEKKDDKPAPAPLTSDVKGNDSFGMQYGNGRGSFLVGTNGSGGNGSGGGSKYGWYAAKVQDRIKKALSENPDTRRADMTITVKIWADNTGRITRASLGNSSGDNKLDDELKNEVFPGLQLQEPPPSDMPMPIVMRITAHRPR